MDIFTEMQSKLADAIGEPIPDKDIFTIDSKEIYSVDFVKRLVNEVYDIRHVYNASTYECHTYYNIKAKYDIGAVGSEGETSVPASFVTNNESLVNLKDLKGDILGDCVKFKSLLLFDETITIVDFFEMTRK